MLKINNKRVNSGIKTCTYEIEINEELDLEEILNIGIYVRTNILKNSIIKIADNNLENELRDNYIKKENEQLNNLLQKKI